MIPVLLAAIIAAFVLGLIIGWAMGHADHAHHPVQPRRRRGEGYSAPSTPPSANVPTTKHPMSVVPSRRCVVCKTWLNGGASDSICTAPTCKAVAIGLPDANGYARVVPQHEYESVDRRPPSSVECEPYYHPLIAPCMCRTHGRPLARDANRCSGYVAP